MDVYWLDVYIRREVYHPEIIALDTMFIEGMCNYSTRDTQSYWATRRRFYNAAAPNGPYAELVSTNSCNSYNSCGSDNSDKCKQQ